MTDLRPYEAANVAWLEAVRAQERELVELREYVRLAIGSPIELDRTETIEAVVKLGNARDQLAKLGDQVVSFRVAAGDALHWVGTEPPTFPQIVEELRSLRQAWQEFHP